MSSKFAHLHTHSHYSLLEALPQVDELVKHAKKLGFGALALTDNGNMFGTIEFVQECRKAEIKPIIGMDAYVAIDTLQEKRHRIDNRSHRMVLLAENMAGYKNLMKLASVGYLDGFYYRPRIDRVVLKERGEGLIGIMGGRSDVLTFLKDGEEDKASARLEEYLGIFGKDRLFFEISYQPDVPAQEGTNASIAAFAKKHGIGLVGTRNIYYLEPDEAEGRRLLLCIKDNRTLEEHERTSDADPDFSMSTEAELREAFKEYPEAITNVEKIVERCDVPLELDKWNFPIFEIPGGISADAYLRKISYDGLAKLLKREVNEEETKRLEYELDIVKMKGYATYFLVVADYTTWARAAGIISTTRGSAAGSLMAFAIGVTTVNPLDFKLPFERFLNPLRPSAPDIDMDFADNRRGEVLEYVKQKYGVDHVAQICTFGTEGARSSVRDTGRALGYPLDFVDKLSKMIPLGAQGFPMTIDRALDKESPELRALYDTDPRVKRLVQLARLIEGCARQCSVHAAGVVISDKPLIEYTPLQREAGGDHIITQYEMHAVESAGVLKMDFLGIRNLSILGNAIDLVKRTKNVDIDLYHMPLDDKQTYEMLARGETMGLFQLNGDGMTKWLVQLKPSNIFDIMAMVALYRPGPMDTIPDFIKRKNGVEKITYLDPRMKDYLQASYGLLVYQDDVLLTAINLAGYDWLEADKFRKAMGKKIPAEMAAQEEKFKKGAIDKGNLTPSMANKLWELFKPFAAYGFNKCLAGDTRIMNPTDGSYRTLKELYDSGEAGVVVALQDDQKLKPEGRFRVVTNGRKPIFDLMTRSGRRIRATANHPFLTISGWTRLDGLKAGDRLALARRLPCGPGVGGDVRKWRALGYLISEGNLCHPHGVYYYSTKEDEVADFIAQLDAFEGCRTTIDRSKSAASVYVGNARQGKKNGLRAWLEELDLIGKKATEKRLPEIACALDEAELSQLIAGMWQGDGCVHPDKGGQVFYATSSPELAEQVQHFLLRLGIFSTKHVKGFNYRGGSKTGFTVNVSKYENLQRFSETVGKRLLPGKRKALETILRKLEKAYQGTGGIIARGTKDIIPASVMAGVRSEMALAGIGLESFAKDIGISSRLFSDDDRRIGYSRPVISRIAEGLESPHLKALAESDVYWDEIVSIMPRGTEMTYDLEVPGSHNFVANDIIVHNSHAASYAIVAYQTAYMKAHFPAEYMTALMTAESGDLDTVAEAVRECKAMGIEVLAPDVNESESGFTYVDDQHIRFGLGAIKNLGDDTIRSVVEERQAHGTFENLEDFGARVTGKAFNKKSLEALAKSGAFGSMVERKRVLDNIEMLLAYNKNAQQERASGQTNIFAFAVPGDAAPRRKLTLREVPPADLREILVWEKDLLGLYVSAHPFAEFEKEFAGLLEAIPTAVAKADKEPVRVGGNLKTVKQITTKKGEPMLFVQLEDTKGECEVIVFPRTLKENGEAWKEGTNIAVTGRVSLKDDERKIIADRGWVLNDETKEMYKKHFRGERVTSDDILNPLKPVIPSSGGEVQVHIPAKLPPATVAALKAAFAKYPGPHKLSLVVKDGGKEQRLETSFRFDPTPDAIRTIESIIGFGNVKVLQAV